MWKPSYPLLLLLLPPPSFSLRGLIKQRLEHHRALMNSTVTAAGAGLEAFWFSQKLDHYDPSNQRTWNQRYWENLENYLEGGPAFIMIGGEYEASPGYMRWGQWYKWAQEQGAAMFQLEHRFYGQSHPTENLSNEIMIYLSSRQGLWDLATFIEAMNKKHDLRGVW